MCYSVSRASRSGKIGYPIELAGIGISNKIESVEAKSTCLVSPKFIPEAYMDEFIKGLFEYENKNVSIYYFVPPE